MLPEHTPHQQAATGAEMLLADDRQTLLQHISDNVIGGDSTFTGPFGEKQGKSIDKVEIIKMPRYLLFLILIFLRDGDTKVLCKEKMID